MKKLSLLLAAIMLAGTLSACSSSDEPTAGGEEGAESRPLIVAINSEATSLDGNGKNDVASIQSRALLYDNLVALDENLAPIPHLAESWEYENETTINFKIREGVMFHNGTELKASDVAFSLKRAHDIGYAKNALGMIDFEQSVAVDDYNYKMVLLYPFAPIISNLSDEAAAIVPEAVVVEHGEEYLSTNPVGTGPYTVTEWVAGDRIEYQRFEDFWGEETGVDHIIIRTITETANRAIEVEVDGVDIALSIATNDVERLETTEGVTVLRGPSLSISYVGMNCTDEVLSNQLVRQAVGHAIDSQAIVNAVYGGFGKVANSTIPSSTWGYSDEVVALDYNPEKSKELLTEAGYADGLTTNIWVSDSQANVETAEILQAFLSEVGITTEIKVLEWGAYLEAVENQELEIYILGKGSSADGDSLYDNFYSTSHFSGNTAFFQNAEVDAMLDAQRVEIDTEARFDMLVEIQNRMNQEAAWVPFYEKEEIVAVGSDVAGFAPNPTSVQDFRTAHFVEEPAA